MLPPRDVLAATTHPDPYPFYARLARAAPFAFDDALGLWIAAGAAAVRAVLASPHLGVRPRGEPVPAALVGTRVGDLHARLARQCDGERHERRRAGVLAVVADVEGAAFERLVRTSAARLWGTAAGETFAARVDTLATRLAPTSLALLLGASEDGAESAALDAARVVRALTPGASDTALAAGDDALARLHATFARAGDDDDARANRIGLLTQSHDATAGWIGNTLLGLARAGAPPAPVAQALADTLRQDPPVQHTRRFVHEGGELAGRTLRAGDVVLVLLASEDAAFGGARHACPGRDLAATIARVAVETVLAHDPELRDLPRAPGYRALPATRVPHFARGASA